MTTSQVARPVTESEQAKPPAAAPLSREPGRVSRRWRRRPGPGRLTVRAVVAGALLALVCTMTVVGAVSVRHEITRLRTSVAERAAVADQLRFSLADLDAERADTLAPGVVVIDQDHSEIVGNQINALITAKQRRAQVSDLLRQLSADTAHGTELREMLDALGRYDDLSGRASYVDDSSQVNGAPRAPGKPPVIAVAMNGEAGDLMKDTLLPKADRLSDEYQAETVHRQALAHDAAVRWALVIGLLGALTWVYLLWWQRELARDYRRRLNPALAVVTACVLAITLFGSLALGAVTDAVTAAGREGLRPWNQLAEARAVAAQAAASESRWFVDKAFATQDAAEFSAMTKSLDSLLSPVGYATDAELPAYRDVLSRYRQFLRDDKKLRQLYAEGNTNDAARLLTEVGRGEIGFDFWDFATTLDGLAGQQLADFTAHVDDARGSLDGWPAVPAGALGFAAVLVLAGVRPRYAEYR